MSLKVVETSAFEKVMWVLIASPNVFRMINIEPREKDRRNSEISERRKKKRKRQVIVK